MKKQSVAKVGAAALVLSLSTVLGTTGQAFGVTGCRTDPTVALSNGYSVQMWNQINTSLSNVRSVSYVLHVPQGATVTSVSYDSTGYLEHVQVVADQKGNQYYETTTVTTTGSNVGYTADAIRRDQTTATANGKTPKSVTMHWAT